MNFKPQNQLYGNTTKRFKLYKSGKLWVVAGLTMFSIAGGALLNTVEAHADVTATAQTTQATTNTQTTSAAAKTTSQSTAAQTSTASAATSTTKTSTAAQTTQASAAAQTSTASAATSTAKTSTAAQTSTASAATSTAKTSASTSAAVVTPKSAVVESVQVASQASTANKTATSAATRSAVTPLSSTGTGEVDATQGTDILTLGETGRPQMDAVDVSSYQSGMSQSDFNTLQKYGVKTVIVESDAGERLREPGRGSPKLKTANAAGLNVDFYHYATFNSTSTAKSEATNLVNFLQTNNVSKKVLLFADMEDESTYTVNAEADLNTFWSTLDAAGYTNHGVYTSNSYLYVTPFHGPLVTPAFGALSTPYTPSSSSLWNTQYGAWQYSSTTVYQAVSTYKGYLDVSTDYNGLLEDSAGTATFGQTSSNEQVDSNVTDRTGRKHNDQHDYEYQYPVRL